MFSSFTRLSVHAVSTPPRFDSRSTFFDFRFVSFDDLISRLALPHRPGLHYPYERLLWLYIFSIGSIFIASFHIQKFNSIWLFAPHSWHTGRSAAASQGATDALTFAG